MTSQNTPVSFENALELRSLGGRIRVLTSAPIPSGAVIVRLRGPRLERPTKYTIQVSESQHCDLSGRVHGETQHACVANAFVDSSDLSRPVIRAAVPIPSGSEITINYCASEDHLAQPFECDCGAAICYGTVRGFSGLTPDQRMALGSQISSYLRKKYHLRREKKAS